MTKDGHLVEVVPDIPHVSLLYGVLVSSENYPKKARA